MHEYEIFTGELERILKPLLKNNIIIYGYNRGGDFIRWFLKYYYKKSIKTYVDRWELSPTETVPHLWAFYYIYEQEDVILNVTPYSIPDEFNDTGEQWEQTKYKDEQIIDLWKEIYDVSVISEGSYPEITFYEWLEEKYNLDITKTIRRQFVDGNGHGYFPTDFRMIYEGILQHGFNPNKDSILDIGSGKGSAVLSFCAAGLKKIGAVEYTDSIYNVLKDNLEKMDIYFEERAVDCGKEAFSENKIICYKGDAAEMINALDSYNWFFMFNPFPKEVLKQVMDNICNSIMRVPRSCHIFYAEPIGHQIILDTGFFEQSGCIKSDYSDTSYYAFIYDSKEEIEDED